MTIPGLSIAQPYCAHSTVSFTVAFELIYTTSRNRTIGDEF